MILPSYDDSVPIKPLPSTQKHTHTALPAAVWRRFASNLPGNSYFYAFSIILAADESRTEAFHQREQWNILRNAGREHPHHVAWIIASLRGDRAYHKLCDEKLYEQRQLLKAFCVRLSATSWSQMLCQETNQKTPFCWLLIILTVAVVVVAIYQIKKPMWQFQANRSLWNVTHWPKNSHTPQERFICVTQQLYKQKSVIEWMRMNPTDSPLQINQTEWWWDTCWLMNFTNLKPRNADKGCEHRREMNGWNVHWRSNLD